jgi:hypothetical protein
VGSLDLRLIADFRDQSFAGMSAAVSKKIVQAFVPHKLGQEASVSGHARDDDAHVIIDFKHFLLVACQIMWAFLETNENQKTVRLNSWLTSTCQDLNVLTTWVLDLRAREVDPCLTASFA